MVASFTEPISSKSIFLITAEQMQHLTKKMSNLTISRQIESPRLLQG
jgi:hypothetical protein